MNQRGQHSGRFQRGGGCFLKVQIKFDVCRLRLIFFVNSLILLFLGLFFDGSISYRNCCRTPRSTGFFPHRKTFEHHAI